MKDFIKFTETDYVDAASSYHDTPGDRSKMRMIHAIQGMMDEAGEMAEIVFMPKGKPIDYDQLRIEAGDYFYFANLFVQSIHCDLFIEVNHPEISLDNSVVLICIKSIEMGKQIKNHFNYGSEFNYKELIEVFQESLGALSFIIHYCNSSVEEIELIMKRKLIKRYEKGYSKHAALNRDYQAEDRAALGLNSENQSAS